MDNMVTIPSCHFGILDVVAIVFEAFFNLISECESDHPDWSQLDDLYRSLRADSVFPWNGLPSKNPGWLNWINNTLPACEWIGLSEAMEAVKRVILHYSKRNPNFCRLTLPPCSLCDFVPPDARFIEIIDESEKRSV
jgi:hypothetical protein